MIKEDFSATITVKTDILKRSVQAAFILVLTRFRSSYRNSANNTSRNYYAFCVKEYAICKGRNGLILHQPDNHQTRNIIRFTNPLSNNFQTGNSLESDTKCCSYLTS